MKSDTSVLLNDLRLQVKELMRITQSRFLAETQETLLKQPEPGKWCAAECLDHLNAYSRFYIPEMEAAVAAHKGTAPASFKSGWLGNYFTKMMQPKQDGTLSMKMQAPKAYRPQADLNAGQVVQEFSMWLQRMDDVLVRAAQADIQHIRIPTTLGNWLKFSLGDTFRFVLAHEDRHVRQALRAMV
ncbi:DinB family protein [Chitinophaga tropicalis]|uniref:DinB-like domain-containing protein n=1 Tax=Chitinophaga tropicalis TaxID=2683588 RepID=A0A7K1TXQ1_9BACT|nr:DinB family protein [Chitinophaga tropicalis]MVT06884.1 hypothetical protein [Chitinophaga tropicalis]